MNNLRSIYIFIGIAALFVFSCNKRKNELVAKYGQELKEHYNRDRRKFNDAIFILENTHNKYSILSNEITDRIIELRDSLKNQNSITYDKSEILQSIKGSKRDHSYIYDRVVIDIDSIVTSIDLSYLIWQNSPWKGDYSDDSFREYILPYRIAHEPLEYYWKNDLAKKLLPLLDGITSVEEAIKIINSNIDLENDIAFYSAAAQSYSMIKRSGVGKCDDRAILTVMALRACGIPAAFDIVPYRGSTNNGHSVASAILPGGETWAFNGPRDEPNTFQVHKTPKIYRNMFSVQDGTLLYKYKDIIDIPGTFGFHNLSDVTHEHNVGVKSLRVEVNNEVRDKIIYLSVFSPIGWQPVAYAQNRGSKTTFENLGTGSDNKGTYIPFCENMGRGIVYLPGIWEEDKLRPVGNAIIHGNDGMQELVPDHDRLQKVELHRKYPKSNRIAGFAEQMIGGRIELSNKPDFSDAKEILFLSEPPLCHVQYVDNSSDNVKYRYLRYVKPSGFLSIALLAGLDSDGQMVKGKAIADDFLNGLADLNNYVDDDPLTFFSVNGVVDAWVGVEFETPTHIHSVAYCPRNDDNEISPGDVYELFYWDRMWISLGVQTADDYSLIYNNVPQNALLWLRNLTKGQEERPFTYENGIQIWW